MVFEETVEACLPTFASFAGDDLTDGGTTDAEVSANRFVTQFRASLGEGDDRSVAVLGPLPIRGHVDSPYGALINYNSGRLPCLSSNSTSTGDSEPALGSASCK